MSPLENVDDLIDLCIPPERRDDLLFVEGGKLKKRWVAQAIEKDGRIAKMAYLNSKPVGLIQYRPDWEERLVEIYCIFVPDKKNLRKGIGSSLLKSLSISVMTSGSEVQTIDCFFVLRSDFINL